MGRRTDMDNAADALYAQVPDVQCKGHCKASCGPINMSYRERARIHQQTGVDIPTGSQALARGELTCPALSEEGRCDVYELRPMICRVWGASEDLPCRWGCQPANGQALLTGAETYRLLGSAMDAGGGCPDRGRLTRAAVDAQLAEHPEVFDTPSARAYRKQGEDNDYYRHATQDIPAGLAGQQVINRYAEAHRAVHERNSRPYA
jgi:hypothetical protein